MNLYKKINNNPRPIIQTLENSLYLKKQQYTIYVKIYKILNCLLTTQRHFIVFETIVKSHSVFVDPAF